MTTKIEIFRITGISPLLMDNPASMDAESMSDTKTKTTTGTKKRLSKEDEAALKVYRLNGSRKSQLFIPSAACRASLWNGAAFTKVGKFSARQMIQAGVFTTEIECPIIHPKTKKKITDYEIFTCSVVNKTRGRLIVHRPMIKDWMIECPMEVDDDFIPANIVETVFNRAGKVAGLLSWRPENKGAFGRYKVKLIK
jgi:hypothetical protein